MNSREWFCLALRVLGVWQLSTVIPYMAMVVPAFFETDPFGGRANSSALIWSFMTTSTGLFLLLFASAIATRLYPNSTLEAGPVSQDLPERMLEVGLRLLGAWLLVHAVHTFATSVANAMVNATYAGVPWSQHWLGADLGQLISAGMYAALGLVVLFTPKRIVAAIDRLRYDAERDAYVPPPVSAEASNEEQA